MEIKNAFHSEVNWIAAIAFIFYRRNKYKRVLLKSEEREDLTEFVKQNLLINDLITDKDIEREIDDYLLKIGFEYDMKTTKTFSRKKINNSMFISSSYLNAYKDKIRNEQNNGYLYSVDAIKTIDCKETPIKDAVTINILDEGPVMITFKEPKYGSCPYLQDVVQQILEEHKQNNKETKKFNKYYGLMEDGTFSDFDPSMTIGKTNKWDYEEIDNDNLRIFNPDTNETIFIKSIEDIRIYHHYQEKNVPSWDYVTSFINSECRDIIYYFYKEKN